MTTNQEGRHASFRAISGTSLNYNSDWLAAALAEGAVETDFNGTIIQWLQQVIPSSNGNINELLQEYAESLGFNSWDDVNLIPKADGFTFQVKTDNAGTSSGNQFTMPVPSTAILDASTTVYWGDGTVDHNMSTFNDPRWTHSFPVVSNIYVSRVTGLFDNAIKFNDGGDKLKLLNISNWGDLSFSVSAEAAFYGCNNLTSTATDTLNTVGCTSYKWIFHFCTSLTRIFNFGTWDSSLVTDFSFFLANCTNLAEPSIVGLDTSSAIDFTFAIHANPLFNYDLFVTGNWTTPNMEQCSAMFNGCSLFDQDVSPMDITSMLGNFSFFLTGTALSTENYDKLLVGWQGQVGHPVGRTLEVGSATYSIGAPATAHYDLINDSSWVIVGGGLEIPNLKLWLDGSDASTISEVSGAFETWDDKADSNFARQTNASRQPSTGVATINGLNAPRYIETNSSRFDTNILLTDYTIFTVSTPNAYLTGSPGLVLGALPGVNNQSNRYDNNTTAALSSFDDTSKVSVNLTPMDYTGIVKLVVNTGDASGVTRTIRDNGVQVASGIYDGTMSVGTIGELFNSTAAGFDLAEVLIYDRLLTGPEIASVESYLNTKNNIY